MVIECRGDEKKMDEKKGKGGRGIRAMLLGVVKCQREGFQLGF